MNINEKKELIRGKVLTSGLLRRALERESLDCDMVDDVICLFDLITKTPDSTPTQELLGRMIKASYK